MQTKTESLDLEIINIRGKSTFDRPDWAKDGCTVWSKAHDSSIKISGSLGDTLFFGKAPSSLPLQSSIESGSLKPPVEAPPGSMSDVELWEQIRSIEDPKFRAIASQLMEDESLSYVEIQPPVAPRFEALPDSMHPIVKKAMPFPTAYSHQVQSFNALKAGKDLGLYTETASGKTGCFIPGILDALLLDPGKTAIFIYPIKALVNDQAAKLREMADVINRETGNNSIRIAIVTGDVPMEERIPLFSPEPPNVLCISPDVLHWQLMKAKDTQRWQGWRTFLRRLQFVVIDEAHSYVGVFGANFVNLMRRLRNCVNSVHTDSRPDTGLISRLESEKATHLIPEELEHLRSLPPSMIAERKLQWICSSATVGNPQALTLTISGRLNLPSQLESIVDSGAGTKGRVFLSCKPMKRNQPLIVSAVIDCVGARMKGLVFLNNRNGTKRLIRMVGEEARRQRQSVVAQECASFYGSMATSTRNGIIQQLSSGEKKCIFTTNALEAGIDLPDLNFVILAGYPGSVMSSRQRMGRCGRTVPGLVIFVPQGGDYLDEYYARHPDLILHGQAEIAQSNPDYPITVNRHLACAGMEAGIPIDVVGHSYGWIGEAVAGKMIQAKTLNRIGQRLTAIGCPHINVNMRGGAGMGYKLMCDGAEVENMDESQAIGEVFPSAIYQATSPDGNGLTFYESKALDQNTKIATLEKLTSDPNESTQAKAGLTVTPLKALRDPSIIHHPDGGKVRMTLSWGKVTKTVFGYKLYENINESRCSNKRCESFQDPQSLSESNCRSCGRTLKHHNKRELIDDIDFDAPLFSSISVPVLTVEVDNTLRGKLIRAAEREKERSMAFTEDGQEMAAGAEALWEHDPLFLALHSWLHQIKFALPVATLFSRHDINGLVKSSKEEEDEETNHDPNEFSDRAIAHIYDTSDSGNGATETLFTELTRFQQESLTLSRDCACEFGCPLCLVEYSCPQQNKGLNKRMGQTFSQMGLASASNDCNPTS